MFVGLSLAFSFMLAASPQASAKDSIKASGNLIKVTTSADFQQGTLSNVEIDKSIGNGALKLKAGVKDGTFTSAVYSVAAFQLLVASWNCDAPEDTYIEVYAKAYVNSKSAWTNWLSWGKWSPYIKRSCAEYPDNSDNLAIVDVDTFTVRGQAEDFGSKVQLKVVLHSDNGSATPVLRQLAATYTNTQKGEVIKPVYAEKRVSEPSHVLLDTPAYSQDRRESDISNSICSPTTITTLLNDRGEDLLPEEVALNNYDFTYQGFGNWSFSVASAGEYGYESYVQYADMDILREELAKGYSVGISVSYSNDKSSTDYVKDAPITTTGHLITVRGYETVNGVDYFDVSDSAVSSDKAALRRYRADQLDVAWKNRIAYIVHDKEANAGEYAPQRYRAELRETKTGSNNYQLFVDGKQINLKNDFIYKSMTDSGAGIVACCLNDSVLPAVAKPTVTTMANKEFDYNVNMTGEGYIHLDPKLIFSNVKSAEKSITVFVITNAGKIYVAPLGNNSVAAMATVSNISNEKGRPAPLIFIIVVVCVLILGGAGALVLLKKRKIRSTK